MKPHDHEVVPVTMDAAAEKEAERKRRIIEAVRDYMRHGHSDFEARRIRTMGAALRKGRK